MKMSRKLLIAFVSIAGSAILGFIIAMPALAEGKFDESWFKKKTQVSDLSLCYNAHMVREISISEYSTGDSLGRDDGFAVATVPTNFGGYDEAMTCRELLGGKGSYGGVLKSSGVSVPGKYTASGSDKNIANFLLKMGYEANGGNEIKQCARYTYKFGNVENGVPTGSSSTYTSAQICATVDSNGNLTSDKLDIGDASSYSGDTSYEPLHFGVDRAGLAVSWYGGGSSEINCNVGENFISDCMGRVSQLPTEEIQVFSGSVAYQTYKLYNSRSLVTTDKGETLATNYKLNSDSWKTAAQNLFGSTTINYSVSEQISLYTIYLNSDADAMICELPDEEKDFYMSSGYIDKPINLVVGGKVRKNCYVHMGTTGKSYNGFNGAKWWKKVSLDEILDYLASNTAPWPDTVVDANATIWNEEEIDEEPPTVTKAERTGTTYTADDTDNLCFENAGAMGWILCPLLSATSKLMGEVYGYVEDSYLQVSTDITGSDSAVHTAWGIIRDVANVIFIMFFLVIIVSQLTGYGVDNYGIKRMLPRLIVTAILVNLSFLICQIAVDVSDILGVNFKAFLESMAPTAQTIDGVGTTMTGIFEVAAAGGILALLTVITGPAIIVGVLMSVVSILISLLFLWLMLLARQVGIVIAIILAPVAIICYMLPNTEQYFKTWRKLMVALLMVYPLCALLIGGGTFVSSVMANIGSQGGKAETNTMLLLGAMFIKVLPYFFIPTLLRKSMQGLSDIGGRIQALGQRASRGAGAALNAGAKRTGAYKNLQNFANEREAERTRNTERRRLQRTVSRLSNNAKTERQKRQLALAQSQLNRMEAEDVEAAVGVKPKSREDLMASATARRFQEDVAAIKDKNVNENRVNNVGVNKGYIGDGSDLSFDSESMAGQLMAFAADGNQEGIYAAVDQLGEKGHSGQEAIRQVMSKLYAEGNTEAIKSISRAVMGNGKLASELKSGARTTYDYAKNAANGQVNGNVNDFSTNKLSAKNYSEESFANMDAEELSRIVAELNKPNGGAFGSGKGSEAEKIRDLASSALRNDLLTGGNKLEKRQLVEQISGQVIPVRQAGGSNGGSGTSGGGGAGAPGVGNSTRAEREAAADATGQAMEDIFEAQREG